jgi:hypothetical protein
MKMADDVDPVAEDCPPERPPDSEADPDVTADEADIADIVCGDTGAATDAMEPAAEREPDPLEDSLHMTREQAVAIWEEAGRPIIHLGPGENCFGLDKLLSHRNINERHLAAVREWLEERQR